MPKVSVIMATYNCEKTVRESIDSIFNQTFTDWEFVICDDCSGDNTYAVLCEYKERYPDKIILLKNDVNSKLSFSLNRCLEVASGEYMARMDADDIAIKTRLEKEVKILDENPQYAAVGGVIRLFDADGPYGRVYYPEHPDKFSPMRKVPFAHPAVMVRKSAYDKLGGYLVSKMTVRSQDHELWFRFFAAGFEGYNLQEDVLFFREDKNAVKRRTAKVRFNHTRILLRGYKMLHYPVYYYPIAFEPVIKAFVPQKLIYVFHKVSTRKK